MSVSATIPWFRLERWHVPVWGSDAGVVIEPYPLLFGLGVVVSLFVTRAYARRAGLDVREATIFYLYGAVPAVIGSHVLNTFFYRPEVFAQAMAELSRGNRPGWPFEGFSSFGGFASVALGIAVWRWRRDRPARPFMDAAAFSFPFGWLFGRLGCFIVKDHPGVPTDFVLGVADYRAGAPPWVTRHDLGLYEVLFCLVAIPAMVWLAPRLRPSGALCGALIVLYVPLRFLLDFLRAAPADGGDPRLLGLTAAQYASVGLLAAGVSLLRGARLVPPGEPQRSIR